MRPLGVANDLYVLEDYREHNQTFDFDLVVPALNEERRIGRTVSALCAHLGAAPWRSRILVVDNGSVDATSAVVDQHGHTVEVDVIGCRTRGKGAAVRAGMVRSSAPWVGYCDADLATPPEAIDRGIELLELGHQVVVGSRRTLGADYLVRQPFHRRAGSRAFHAFTARLTGPISDSQCGFKLFDGDIARALFSTLRTHGYAFDVEVVAKARHRNLDIVELPVAWSDQQGSTFRPLADGVRAFRDLREVTKSCRHAPERLALPGVPAPEPALSSGAPR